MGWKKTLRSVLGLPKSDDVIELEDELWQAQLHPDAHPEGGLACNDDKLLSDMRAAIMVWLKQIGRQILSGALTNLVNVSTPVAMFEPRSFLEKLADVWVHPDMLCAAANATDPLERMKRLVAWFVAGTHHANERWKKPFNPVLGETWQATLPGGVAVYAEQISHRPPVSAYFMEGPQEGGGRWTYTGWILPAVVPVVKWYGIRTAARGERRLTLADGTVIEIHAPGMALKGIVYQERPRAEVIGVARIIDAANRLEAVLRFGPVQGSRHRVMRRADAVVGEIYKLPPGAQGADAFAGGAMRRTATLAVALDECEAAGGCASGGPPSLATSSLGASGSEADPPADEDEGGAQAAAAEAALRRLVTEDGAPSPSASPPPPPPQRAGGAAAAAGGGAGLGGAPPHQLHRSQTFSEGASSAAASQAAPAPQGGLRVPGVAVAHIEGSWLSHLNVDNQRYWTLSEGRPQTWTPEPEPLPSDCSHRADLLALRTGDLAAAQKVKERVEGAQRADRKLREAAGVHEGGYA